MRRYSLLFAVCTPLVLAGCATGPGLKTRMVSYIGAPEQQLVQALGVPDKQITVNGVQYLAYLRQQEQVQADSAVVGFGGWGGPFGGPFSGGAFLLGVPQDVQFYRCETTFTVQAGRVANVTFKGNDCD